MSDETHELISGWTDRLTEIGQNIDRLNGDDRRRAMQEFHEVLVEMQAFVGGTPFNSPIMPRFMNALIGMWTRYSAERSEAMHRAIGKLTDTDVIALLKIMEKEHGEAEDTFNPIDKLAEVEDWYRRNYPDHDPAKETDAGH